MLSKKKILLISILRILYFLSISIPFLYSHILAKSNSIIFLKAFLIISPTKPTLLPSLQFYSFPLSFLPPRGKKKSSFLALPGVLPPLSKTFSDQFSSQNSYDLAFPGVLFLFIFLHKKIPDLRSPSYWGLVHLGGIGGLVPLGDWGVWSPRMDWGGLVPSGGLGGLVPFGGLVGLVPLGGDWGSLPPRVGTGGVWPLGW